MEAVKKVAIVLNGFIHDFATGYWLSDLIAIYLLQRYRVQSPELATLILGVQRFFFWNCVGAAVTIFATGGMRSFTYVDNFFGEDVEKTRRKMLILKHIVLFVIVGGGIFWGYRMCFA